MPRMCFACFICWIVLPALLSAMGIKLSHGELLEHLKDKDPAYYYTDILVSNGKTLGDFISRR